MFICQKCKRIVEPHVSPVGVVLQTRPVSYHNEFTRKDDLGRVKHLETDSVGWEILQETHVCPECAEPLGVSRPKLQPRCDNNKVFQEKLPERFTQPLIGFVVQRLLDRLAHREKGYKRATRDCEVGVPLVKGFTDRNKEYVF